MPLSLPKFFQLLDARLILSGNNASITMFSISSTGTCTSIVGMKSFV